MQADAVQDHVQIEHWKQLRLQLLVALHSSRPLVCFSLPALNHRPGATPLQEEKDCLAKARVCGEHSGLKDGVQASCTSDCLTF
eukprot:1158609-Pelagomonas_calceolata.AAC.2